MAAPMEAASTATRRRAGAAVEILRQLSKHRLLLVGVTLVVVIVATTIFAPLIAPYSPTAQDFEGRLAPSWDHPMGTDRLGRDVFSRVIYGGAVPLIVGFVAVFLALTIGSTLGWVSGYVGGLPDRGIALVMDALYSFPGLILAIALSAVLGRGVSPMVMAIAVVYIPTYFRVVRGQVFQIKEQEFIEAARALGFGWGRVLLRHIAPNTLSSMLVVVPFNIADAILTEAGLSFLGFGVRPPTPDWGFDISNGQEFLLAGDWWMVTFPGLMIIIVALGFGMAGEGISDWLNPQRKRR